MTEQQVYFQHLMQVFEGLERWAPGSEEDSARAFTQIPRNAERILEVGCGAGLTTLLLARLFEAKIIAVDSQPQALAALQDKIDFKGLTGSITSYCMDMQALELDGTFDAIVAEACAYALGVERAVDLWRPLLNPGGVMIISDLVWEIDQPTDACRAFWQQAYADMSTASSRRSMFERCGFSVLEEFSLSDLAWRNYYQPLAARVAKMREQQPETFADSAALADIEREIAVYEEYQQEFGYRVFVLQG